MLYDVLLKITPRVGLTMILVTAVVTACAILGRSAGGSARPSSIQEKFLRPGRRYTIAIPKNYTDDLPIPLILALHYGGHGAPFFGKFFLTGLVEPALRKLKAIIVAPDCPGGVDWTDERSETEVLTLLDFVYDTYNIDPRRTLITGYSMGGAGTWYLAARHPDLFSAALVMAGRPTFDVKDIQWDIPLYIIHSRQDEVVPLEPTETAVSQLKDRGIPVELVIIDGITHYETNRFVGHLRAAIPWIEQAWQRFLEGVR